MDWYQGTFYTLEVAVKKTEKLSSAASAEWYDDSGHYNQNYVMSEAFGGRFAFPFVVNDAATTFSWFLGIRNEDLLFKG